MFQLPTHTEPYLYFLFLVWDDNESLHAAATNGPTVLAHMEEESRGMIINWGKLK
jgi:hypothetical protein